MSPLQLSVYWRLSILFFFMPFLFFLDIFTAAVAAVNCHHGNATGSMDPFRGTSWSNQSQPGEVSEGDADWRTESAGGDVSVTFVRK